MGNYGEFVPSADGKRKVVTKIAAVKEEFSNWREDLNSSEEDQNVDTIKEMPRGKKNKIKFNPEVAIENLVTEKGGEILEVKEVDLQEKGMSSDEMSSVLKGHKYTKRQLLDMSKKSTREGRHGEADALYKEFQREESEVEEGYKEIDRDKENRMYRRAGNLARQSLASKGMEKKDTAKKSAKIVSAITRQKENERFAKMGDEKARDNYGEEVELGEASYTPGNAKPFPYGKVGDKLRKLAGERDAEKDPKKRNKLASRLSKINREYNLPEEFEKSDWRSELNPVDEKMNLATADMGDVIKDFYKSDAPQFKGKTKEEIRKMAIAAKLDAERGVDEKVNPLLKGILKKTPKGEDPKKGGVPYKITGRMTEKKELSIDDQMRIARDAAKDRNPNPDHQAIRGRQIRNSKAPKDTRTDAEKMADAYASPRKGPGGATRAD